MNEWVFGDDWDQKGMGGIDTLAGLKPLASSQQARNPLAAQVPTEAPAGVKTKVVARNAKSYDGKTLGLTKGQWLGVGAGVLGVVGAAIYRKPRQRLAAIEKSFFSDKNTPLKAEKSVNKTSLLTREEWLAKTPVTSHTRHVWEEIIDNNGNLVCIKLSEPIIPEAATPEKFRISFVLDNFLDVNIPVKPSIVKSHAEIVQELVVHGDVKNNVGILGFHFFNDSDTAILEVLEDVLLEKSSSYSDYLTHLNCSFGHITPAKMPFGLCSSSLYFKEIEERKSDLLIRIKLAESGKLKIFQAVGNSGPSGFDITQFISHPNFQTVGALNLDGSVLSKSSQTPFVKCNASGVFPFTVSLHPKASPYRIGISEELLINYIPDDLKSIHGQLFSNLNQEDFVMFDGFILKKFKNLDHLTDNDIIDLPNTLDTRQKYYYKQFNGNDPSSKGLADREFWINFLNNNPSFSSHSRQKFILNHDGTLNYVIPEFSFAGTSYSNPIAQNKSLSESLGLESGGYTVITDPVKNLALYAEWREKNIPSELLKEQGII